MGEKLKHMLETKNVKQVDIARLLGVSDKQKTPRGVLDVERERLVEKRLVKLLKKNFPEDELCIGGLGEFEESVSQSDDIAVNDNILLV